MFLYMLYQGVALLVLALGARMGASSDTWTWVFGVLIFVGGAEAFSEASILRDRRKRMPYRWECPICRSKGKPTGMESSVEEVTLRFRDSHNRTVHLMEP